MKKVLLCNLIIVGTTFCASENASKQFAELTTEARVGDVKLEDLVRSCYALEQSLKELQVEWFQSQFSAIYVEDPIKQKRGRDTLIQAIITNVQNRSWTLDMYQRCIDYINLDTLPEAIKGNNVLLMTRENWLQVLNRDIFIQLLSGVFLRGERSQDRREIALFCSASLEILVLSNNPMPALIQEEFLRSMDKKTESGEWNDYIVKKCLQFLREEHMTFFINKCSDQALLTCQDFIEHLNNILQDSILQRYGAPQLKVLNRK